MKKLMFLVVLVAIGFMFSGCSDMNQDITSANQVDKIPKPFWGNWEGLTYLFPEQPTFRQIICSGNCTHLGLFNAEVTYYLTYNDPNVPPNPLLGGGLTDGQAIMTAANGDKVYLSITGNWWVGSYENPIIWFNCNGVVTGGTGRFEGATGTITGSGTQNFYGPESTQPQEIWYSWTGQILY